VNNKNIVNKFHQDQGIFYEQVNGVYVDGRKEATLTTTCLESGKIYQSTCSEEHIAMVEEQVNII